MAPFRKLFVFTFVLYTAGSASGAIVRNKLRDVDWFSEGQQNLKQLLSAKYQTGAAKNVILVIGDGMGISTSTAARVLKAQRDQKSLFETKLAWEEFPFSMLVKPYNVDQLTSDSAGAATALMSGVKTNHGMLGLNSKAIRSRCETAKGNQVPSILHHSHSRNKWTGIVTTSRITHATPGGAFAATPERKWESDAKAGCKDIAAQLVEDHNYIKVLLGGGRAHFLSTNETDPAYLDVKGERADGRNLMRLWEATQADKEGVGQAKSKLVTNKEQFDNVDPNNVDYLMGLFEPFHMSFEADREDPSINKDSEPSLADMVEKAIKILKRGKDGFFLLVEGQKIDRGHHDNNAYRALTDALALSEAVKRAGELTSEEDTLTVVTADHSHTFIVNGYSHPDNDILGLSRSVITGEQDETELQLSQDGKPYLTLSYGNGPGYLYHRSNGSLSGATSLRKNLTQDELDGRTGEKDYLQDGLWPRKSETHAGEEVGLYARGPMSHLFRGVQEQSSVAHIMMYASCVGPNRDLCQETGTGTSPHRTHRIPIALSLITLVYSLCKY